MRIVDSHSLSFARISLQMPAIRNEQGQAQEVGRGLEAEVGLVGGWVGRRMTRWLDWIIVAGYAALSTHCTAQGHCDMHSSSYIPSSPLHSRQFAAVCWDHPIL